MRERKTLTAGGRELSVYPAEKADGAPLVLLLGGEEDAQAVLRAVEERSERPFSLAVIPVADWEDELSPWKAEKVFRGGRDFGGGGETFLRALEETFLPAVRKASACREALCFLAGYSLAGLFALWALYRSTAFSGAVSASGSLWFPGWADFAAANEMPRRPERVYLSLGDRESRTKNPVTCKVEENTAALYALLRGRGIECVFDMNPGNHFQDAELRLAKGIAWLLR